ncbi:hypothetical protein [Massilia brevitalea]|uniref:hypothetical protein n=1 Tax=Massilia brevitalea TaxID=442526 RepID=UPI002738DC29|nr:hypothetical protein [Massilia brevitalea]
MLRTTTRFASLSLALLACTGTAVAQQTAAGQTAPTAQPPVTERIEPGSDVPATTIEPRRGTQITEKRGNDGNVTEVEVQSGRSNYILRPNTPAGNAQAGDAQSSAFRAPQWKVMEFDLNAKKKAAGAEAAEAAANDATPAKPAPTPASGAPAGKVPAATVPMTRPADIPPPPPLPANGR